MGVVFFGLVAVLVVVALAIEWGAVRQGAVAAIRDGARERWSKRIRGCLVDRGRRRSRGRVVRRSEMEMGGSGRY